MEESEQESLCNPVDLEIGEWYDEPEFLCCSVVHEYQQVQMACKIELSMEEIMDLQAAVRAERSRPMWCGWQHTRACRISMPVMSRRGNMPSG